MNQKEFYGKIISFCNNSDSHKEHPLSYATQLLSNIENGLYLEYGVHRGGTISYVLRILPSWNMYGFDSFKGLPEKWRDGFDKGAFSLQGNIPNLDKRIKLVAGLFEESIPTWLKNVNYKKVDLLHIDCDLYSSTKTVFKYISHLIIPSHTIIVFDELINYPGYENHEIKALYEYCEENSYDIEILCSEGERCALKLIRINS
jgi:hypothetical protein